MDLRIPWKVLSKEGASSSTRSAFSSKRIAFLVIAGLALIAGIVLRSSHYFTQWEVEQNAPVEVAPSPPPAATTTESVPQPTSPPPGPSTSPVGATDSVSQSPAPVQERATGPNEQKEPTGEGIKEPGQAEEAVEHSEQPEPPGSGMILVSKQPIGLLASPSPSASVLYGFPAGRPFRVIGHDGGFAHIQDLKSSASGWIDEAALEGPPRVPVASAYPQPKPYSVSRIPPQASWAGSKPKASKNDTATAGTSPKSKATKNNTTTTAESEVATPPVRKRPGLFGGGGLFGGIFGNGN
jgi:hypothetical protein